jgi:hypothetical protein
MRNSGIMFGTKDQANGRVFLSIGPMFSSIVQIEIHLPGVGMSELSEFQFDDNEASEFSMEEEQIDSIPFGAYPFQFSRGQANG